MSKPLVLDSAAATQVRDWDEGKGKGQPQLENLEVQGFAQQDADVAGDLYTVIAKRLQLLEVRIISLRHPCAVASWYSAC